MTTPLAGHSFYWLKAKMINTLLGIKKGMTSSYDARGRRVGATIIEVEPNFVTQIKSVEKDGYQSVQIGTSSKKSVKKPQIGHFKKAGIEKTLKYLKEVKTDDVSDITPGKEIKVNEVFRSGDAVKVTGVSKGRGFAGGVKRYGFAGGPKTHGQSDRHRAPGSSGSGTTPGRVYKGKRRPGHMGVENVTYRNLEVISVDRIANLIILKGGVPGPIGGLITIQKLGQIKGYTPPPEPEVEEEEEATVSNEAQEVVETQAVEEPIKSEASASEVKENA